MEEMSFSEYVSLPLSQISQWGDEVVNGGLLKGNKPVIVTCRSGKRSYDMCGFLTEKCRLDNVYNLDGGILGYAEAAKEDGSVVPLAVDKTK